MQVHVTPSLTIGYDEAGQGRPLLLLHAFPLCREMWREQIVALAPQYRVMAPDLRGFGDTSPFAGTPSLDNMAQDVEALLKALGMEEPVTLCGLSMGGYVALAFARLFPHRLSALILADTRAEADTAEGKTRRDEMIALARSQSSRDVIEQMLPNLTCDATRREKPEVVAAASSMAARQPAESVAAALRAMRDRPDARPVLPTIKVPALVIVGAEDVPAPPTAARALANGIDGARLVTIPDAGHLSNLEQPRAFNQAVAGFLAALE